MLAKIELDLSRPNFLTWFQETGIADITNGSATVRVPNAFVKEWLENKYHKIILHAARAIAYDIKSIQYVIAKQEGGTTQNMHDSAARKRRAPQEQAPSLPDDMSSLHDLSINPQTNLNPRYTLDAFIVGSFNELAHAAAQSVIRRPGASYNPLFIYGGVGLGKTHLIQAIGNEILKTNALCKVKYLTSEKFMVEVVEALRTQSMNALKEKYRAMDVLVVDDIQFIARTEKMQEEFFHTFNALYDKNKQIIISSDRPPHAIATLENRLRSRFEGGMIADIGFPDFETRLLILRTKVNARGASLSEEILRHLAERITQNIRELEGAVNRIVVASKVSRAPLTLEDAKRVLASHISAPKKFISPKKIIKAVADFYDIEEGELVHRSRKKDVVRPRQIAMYLMRRELKTSFPAIGEKFGGRDHTTAIHSCAKIVRELEGNSELEEEIRTIREQALSK